MKKLQLQDKLSRVEEERNRLLQEAKTLDREDGVDKVAEQPLIPIIRVEVEEETTAHGSRLLTSWRVYPRALRVCNLHKFYFRY